MLLRRRHRGDEPALLRTSPALRALWLARGISFTGDGVARVGLVLAAAPSGAGAVSAVLLAGTLPRLLGPVAGAVVDRVDQRRLMLLCDLGQLTAYGVLAALGPPLRVVVPVVALCAVLVTLSGPAGRTLVATMVPPARLSEANSLLSTASALQLVAGPVLGGTLVTVVGVRWAFAVDAATFLASACLVRRLPAGDPVTRRRSTIARGTLDGLAYVRRTPSVRGVLLGLCAFIAFASMDNVAVPFLVRDRLHGSQAGYGLVVACFGIGLLAGASLAPALDRRVGTPTLLVAGLLGGAAGVAVTAVAPVVAVAGGGQIVAGSGNAIDEIASTTILQRTVPTEMLGRVFGALGTLAQAGTALAYVAAPALVDAVGPRSTLVVAATGMAAGGALMIAVARTASDARR